MDLGGRGMGLGLGHADDVTVIPGDYLWVAIRRS
jgi:hypothetical protein